MGKVSKNVFLRLLLSKMGSISSFEASSVRKRCLGISQRRNRSKS